MYLLVMVLFGGQRLFLPTLGPSALLDEAQPYDLAAFSVRP